jgi:hypothetical protein
MVECFHEGVVMYLPPMGDATVPASSPTTFHDLVSSETVSTASMVALTYHGYKRTGSLIWALVYGLAGRWVPVVAVPVAMAQGFGERKPCP